MLKECLTDKVCFEKDMKKVKGQTSEGKSSKPGLSNFAAINNYVPLST